MKALIFCIAAGTATASATEQRISFEPPQNVAAIKFSEEKNSSQINVYGNFLLAPRDSTSWFKATQCLHLTYSKAIQPEVSLAGNEEGTISANELQKVMRFTETLKDVRQIDIVDVGHGALAYVFSKDQVFRVRFMANQQPKLDKINELEVPVMKPHLILVVPKGNIPPVFKKSDD